MLKEAEIPGTPGWRMASGRTPGEGPLLLYLHGLGCNGSRDWPPVVAAPALDGRASLWVDMLGFGQSDKPHGFSYDLAEQADFLARVLVAEPGPLVLVGHSMGGTLSVLLAERLAELGRPPLAVIAAEPNLRLEDGPMSIQVANKTEERFVRAWPRWVEAFPSPHYQQNMALADPVAFYRSAVSLVKHTPGMLERFSALPVKRKGYILGGLSGPERHESAALVGAAGVPVQVVERSGHGFSEDDPAGFAEAVRSLLTRGSFQER